MLLATCYLLLDLHLHSLLSLLATMHTPSCDICFTRTTTTLIISIHSPGHSMLPIRLLKRRWCWWACSSTSSSSSSTSSSTTSGFHIDATATGSVDFNGHYQQGSNSLIDSIVAQLGVPASTVQQIKIFFASTPAPAGQQQSYLRGGAAAGGSNLAAKKAGQDTHTPEQTHKSGYIPDNPNLHP